MLRRLIFVLLFLPKGVLFIFTCLPLALAYYVLTGADGLAQVDVVAHKFMAWPLES